MHLELSQEEAALLKEHLSEYIQRLDHELVRTDKHDLQHALARDIERLKGIAARLERLIETT